jgi:hypothetical protein
LGSTYSGSLMGCSEKDGLIVLSRRENAARTFSRASRLPADDRS